MVSNGGNSFWTGDRLRKNYRMLPVPDRTLLGLLLGPMVGLMIWWLPLGVTPAAHKALAIAGFMLAYWIMEPVDHGITALIGCYLFWALKVTTFSTAFSGFTSPIPWFLFGTLVLGEVASRTGLAKRVGYLVITKVGLPSYAQLVLGIITLIFLLNFLIPSPQAQIAIVAPLLIGLIMVFESGSRTTVAKGLFVLLTYTCTLFGKMILSSNSSILARGIIEAQTGQQVFWSQWLLAFLPVTLLTIVAGWLTILWLYPVERLHLSRGQQFLREELEKLGPWSRDEQRALACLLLAVSLWATDLVHHLHPGMIALGMGLFLVLPKVGLLDMKAVRTLNFLLVIFMAGALSMGNVLNETAALTFLMKTVVGWIAPLLSDPWQATTILYWGGFLYHFLMADNAMVVTGLPVLLQVADVEGYHPIAMGLIWTFTTGGKVFVYQAASYIVGYSYGYFEGKDLLKVGAVLTVVEGILLMVVVPLYWPLIGLPWRITPPSQSKAFTVSGAGSQAPADMPSHSAVQHVQGEPLLSLVEEHPHREGTEETSPSRPSPAGEALASDRPHDPVSMSRRISQTGTAPSGALLRSVIGVEHSGSAQVRQAQEQLKQMGFNPGALDGHLGPRTKAALRRYQAARGLPSTGGLDEATRKALGL
jgi:solute carrier family 13 (sodium-dependent dicarboxylate transporter), member 2/3/5